MEDHSSLQRDGNFAENSCRALNEEAELRRFRIRVQDLLRKQARSSKSPLLEARLCDADLVEEADGTHARDVHGREMRMTLTDADSGVFLRGDGKFQVNIWCWPIGSGEMYGIRTDPAAAPDLRAAATPRTQADRTDKPGLR